MMEIIDRPAAEVGAIDLNRPADSASFTFSKATFSQPGGSANRPYQR